jgi:hypothetical protein
LRDVGKLNPIHAGHDHVRQDQVGIKAGKFVYGLRSSVRNRTFVTMPLKNLP